ncbi:MAG: hypothetical protein KBT33_04790 [Prevotellaceae bacterium]|nr:hypothetical protein [Candidatus Minthosoma equi]
MRWIKLHGNMLSDKRLLRLQKDHKLSGIGIYYTVLSMVECLGEGSIHIGQIIGSLNHMTSRKKILDVITNYDLFVMDEYGMVWSNDPIPGYSESSLKDLRLTDARQPCERPHACISHTSKENTNQDKIREEVRFRRPSLSEVMSYCIERHNGIDAEHFLNFYEARGWKYGSTKITDWKACVRTWEKKSFKPVESIQPTANNIFDAPLETTDAEGNRYADGQRIPDDAPPRPSANALWDESSYSWIEFYN